jgi:alpha-beta hydrolase superfamily lysophospholipase
MLRSDHGYLSSRDRSRLFWRSLAPEGEAVAQLAIVHGLGDHSGRYLEAMAALAERGLSTIAVDYRGHGLADGPRTDCRRWDEYVDDLEAFWRKAVSEARGVPTFLLGHSHGGLVASHWAALDPPGLRGLLLASPFYALASEPSALEHLGVRLLRRLRPGARLASGLRPELLTRDPAQQRATAADPLHVSTFTPRWFLACQAAQADVEALARAIEVPVWLGVGSADRVVSSARAGEFFGALSAPDRVRKEYEGFHHELWNDLGRERVLDDIARWILAHR